MDPQLSILMANQGLCKSNDLMFDPFCGTGSMLVAGALFGSYVIGMDIDYLTLHAKTKPSRALQKVRAADESIRANMEQYNLQNLYLDVFVGDFANYPLHDNLTFDSIICDRK
jgi:tRNA (guanine10-N2)-methyltransferase